LIYLIKLMLDRRKKYLQIAFNRSLEEIALAINYLPLSDRIIIEAGYPLIKNYGVQAISAIRTMWHEKIFGIQDQAKNVATGGSFTLTGLGISFIDSLLKSAAKPVVKKSTREEGGFKKIHFNPYIVADLKCMDRAFTEVEAAAKAGASAATCLGLAPVETIDEFIKRCEELKIDSMLDMMNVEY
jgi:3-keto-L-gulonate-6-phosphate decarboxylase